MIVTYEPIKLRPDRQRIQASKKNDDDVWLFSSKHQFRLAPGDAITLDGSGYCIETRNEEEPKKTQNVTIS